MAAIDNKLSTVSNKLIDQGADINLLNYDGESALVLACEGKLDDIAIKLIENGAELNLPVGDNQYSVLMTCYRNSMPKVANCLIDYGANLYLTNHWGASALIFFCHKLDFKDIVVKLIKNGADVDLQE